MRCEPTNPAPPVTSNVWLTNFLPLRRSAAKATNSVRPHSNQRVGPPGGDELPGTGGGRCDDRGTVVTGDRVGEHPRREPATVVATQVGHRELAAGGGEVEPAAVVDADRADVAGVDVLKGGGAADAGAEHTRTRAVDLDVLEVHVGDRVEVLHRPVRDLHDRVVRVVEEVVADDLDVRVDVLLEGVE